MIENKEVQGGTEEEKRFAATVCQHWITQQLTGGLKDKLNSIFGTDGVIGTAHRADAAWNDWMVYVSDAQSRAQKEEEIRQKHTNCLTEAQVEPALYIFDVGYAVIQEALTR